MTQFLALPEATLLLNYSNYLNCSYHILSELVVYFSHLTKTDSVSEPSVQLCNLKHCTVDDINDINNYNAHVIPWTQLYVVLLVAVNIFV